MEVKDIINWKDVNYLQDKLTQYEDVDCKTLLHVYLGEEANKVKLFTNYIKLYQYNNGSCEITNNYIVQDLSKPEDIQYDNVYYVIIINSTNTDKTRECIAEFYSKVQNRFEKLPVSLSTTLYIKSRKK